VRRREKAALRQHRSSHRVAQDSWTEGWALSGVVRSRLNFNAVDDSLLGAANYV
jgi:hypothetical protein